MMFFALKRWKFTSGAKTRGVLPWVAEAASRPSVSMRMGAPQWAQGLVTSAVIRSFLSRPCTKGAAIASTAQAAYARSPVRKASRCTVGSAVSGYAQATAPRASRKRKVRRRSRSSRSRAT
jgi:hypothetical protein